MRRKYAAHAHIGHAYNYILSLMVHEICIQQKARLHTFWLLLLGNEEIYSRWYQHKPLPALYRF